MADTLSMHITGFDEFDKVDFDKSKVRAGFRQAGKIVTGRAQMLLALGKGQDGYPTNRTGALLHAISFKVSRSGFMVRVMPNMPEGSKEYYPAYLHYGVRQGARVTKLAPGQGLGRSNRRARGARGEALAARKLTGWRIAPRDNYIVDALQDSAQEVEGVLAAALGRALRPK
ncbi:hypothetical protein JW897_12270 [Chromobacterium alkanivorans]|uniref:hypothetical protein n=1 Tax=Chromobacterium alkanivorans TaxID=1071719 RepID=UPI0019688463|nr:hypothetical protein [Chromobacterium alkanivorans]MBN3004511.1 hypothetical protein [Chromobacterium alkanivorans]